MNKYYISLSKDLIGYYLVVHADSDRAVRQYLEREYFDSRNMVWKLPWCSIYTEDEIKSNPLRHDPVKEIKIRGELHADN